MKRSVDPTLARPASGRRSWKELWKRLLTEDDLEGVEGGGAPKPITTGNGTDDSGG
jgi:hypothetical protein